MREGGGEGGEGVVSGGVEGGEGGSVRPSERGRGRGRGRVGARFLPDDGIGAPRARRPRAARTQTSFALSVAATHRRGSRGRLRGPRSARSARRSAHSIGATRTPARGEDASEVAADEDVMRRARGIAAHSGRSSERSVRDGRNVQVFFSWTTGPAAFILRLPFPIGFKPCRVPFEPTGVSPSGRRSPIGAPVEPATRLKAG